MPYLNSFTRAAKARYEASVLRASTNLAPVRPLVLIESDDWGRCGTPSRDSIHALCGAGLLRSPGPWDFYGLETAGDVEALTRCLSTVRDRDGRSACMTANIIMANLDVERKSSSLCKPRRSGAGAEHFNPGGTSIDGLTLVSLDEGLPSPWTEDLPAIYREAEETGAFRPELHGLTHFSTPVLAAALQDDGDLGQRVRALLATGTPYLRSVTPELNFALVDGRYGRERVLPAASQREWLTAAISIFERLFARKPASFCPPGYRYDSETLSLLKEFRIGSIQTVHQSGFVEVGGVVSTGRNVAFEPVLVQVSPRRLVDGAYGEAICAARRGQPIVICSHSINYMSRFVNRSAEALQALQALLRRLVQDLPDLRFCHVDEAVEAWRRRDPEWYRSPRPREILARLI